MYVFSRVESEGFCGGGGGGGGVSLKLNSCYAASHGCELPQIQIFLLLLLSSHLSFPLLNPILYKPNFLETCSVLLSQYTPSSLLLLCRNFNPKRAGSLCPYTTVELVVQIRKSNSKL
jgi:hypothetical protein